MPTEINRGRVIWERTIDWDLQAKRRRQFVRLFVGPAVLALMIALVFGGVGAMLGVLIVALLLGLLVGTWIELRNVNRRRFRTLRVIDGELVLDNVKQRVPIRQVQRFTTQMMAIESTTYAGGTAVDSSIAAGGARFLIKLDEIRRGRLTDTSHDWIDFKWPLMTPDQLEVVRAAIEPELPVAWTDPEEFMARVEDGIGNVPLEEREQR
ncbi:MAG: hypothetical protein IPK93_12020 [Solirubrobacterales bacterium]|nr:hypothetical protein [Solirubrobacterales bacterium]